MLEILDKAYVSAQSDTKIGLSQSAAEERLARDGRNSLAKEKKSRPVKIFFGQFKDVMVMILLAATVISILLGEIYDAVTIILIVLLNAVLGFIQEYRTEKTLEALNRMTAPAAKCYRDGRLQTIPAAELVCEDVIELGEGDRVPADCVLTACAGLSADESVLTGEAVAVEKSAGSPDDRDNSLNRSCIVYSGTVITKGHGRGTVIATGMSGQMGKISGMLSEIDEEQTPLQIRLAELGKVVAIICLAVCGIVFGAGVLHGEPVFDMLLTGISIAIAAIPEGLPASVTIALALAVSRMLKQKALVHKLHSVETLGCTSVICSDKTGTITENRMTVKKIFADGEIYDVSGDGYKISGEITREKLRVNPIQRPTLREAVLSSVLCNNASISSEKSISSRERGKLSADGEWTVSGDPTEIALMVAAAKCGISASDTSRDFRRISEIPFDSESRIMTVIVSTKAHEKIAYAKGAIDVILKRCDYIQTEKGVVSLTPARRRELLEENDKLSDEALRVLAFAKKSVRSAEDSRHGMIFLGLMGMLDPPRAEAKQAIRLCAKAHIKTVMITGDHKNTAVAIARQAGILKGPPDGKVMTGAELSEASDSRLAEIIDNICVFARVNPSDKLRIVKAFKKRGHIVTMTGDGVNDAPAIKEASIGVSMGITGTDVTKQAADVILLDDNFATLVGAVEQGRTIYSNIRKFVRYLLSCNIGEVITMFLGILMGLPLVLLPTQILLVNLVTDGLPAIALGVEPVDRECMYKKPRAPDEGFFSGGLMGKIVFRGILIGLCTLGCFTTMMNLFGSVDAARTGALFTLVMSQLLHVFECKSEEKNLFTVPYFNNMKLVFAVLASAAVIFGAVYFPPLQLVFETIPLNSEQLLIASGFSFAIPIVCAVGSLFKRK